MRLLHDAGDAFMQRNAEGTRTVFDPPPPSASLLGCPYIKSNLFCILASADGEWGKSIFSKDLKYLSKHKICFHCLRSQRGGGLIKEFELGCGGQINLIVWLLFQISVSLFVVKEYVSWYEVLGFT